MTLFGLVTSSDLQNAVNKINKRIDKLEASEQGQIDALTSQVTQVSSDLETATQNLQAEIDSLASANPSLDLSALTNAIAPLDEAVNSLNNLKPTPPSE